MSDTAVWLTEHVIPREQIRQWVLSKSWRLRVRGGYNRQLCALVVDTFVRELQHGLCADVTTSHVNPCATSLKTFDDRNPDAWFVRIRLRRNDFWNLDSGKSSKSALEYAGKGKSYFR
jgi:hypothetical protein